MIENETSDNLNFDEILEHGELIKEKLRERINKGKLIKNDEVDFSDAVDEQSIKDMRFELKKLIITNPDLSSYKDKQIDSLDYDTLSKEFELCRLRQAVSVNKLLTQKTLDLIGFGIGHYLNTPTLIDRIRKDEPLQNLTNSQLTLSIFSYFPEMLKFGILMSSNILGALNDKPKDTEIPQYENSITIESEPKIPSFNKN